MAEHIPTVRRIPGARYSWRPECSCGSAFRGYVSRDAATVMAEATDEHRPVGYVDRDGRLITVDTQVRVVPGYRFDGPAQGLGVVVMLPPRGSALYGSPFVRFDSAGVTRNMPSEYLITVG